MIPEIIITTLCQKHETNENRKQQDHDNNMLLTEEKTKN